MDPASRIAAHQFGKPASATALKISLRAAPRWYRLLLYLMQLLALSALPAQGDDTVQIVLSGQADYYHQVADAVRQVVATHHPTLNLPVSQLDQLTDPLPDGQLLITVGTQAATRMQARYPNNPQLGLFITTSTWQQLAAGATQPNRLAAVVIDQPFERFLQLALLLDPDSHTIATVYSTAAFPHQGVTELLAQQHLTLLSATLQTHNNPVAVLTSLFADADVFIPQPGNNLFNQSVARWALFLGYRHKVPIIGYSRAYTEAGALASVQSDPTDIGRQGGRWVERYLAGEPDLWQAYLPEGFTVALNPAVARALGLAVDTEEHIHQQLVRRLTREQTP